MPGETWGDLEIIEIESSTPVAATCRARTRTDGREVVVQLYDANAEAFEGEVARWIDEARQRSTVHHPHLAPVLGGAIHRGAAGIWSEPLQGRLLSDLLRDRGRLEPEQVAALGGELCGAIAALHAHGLLQRDLDPSRVLVAKDGRVRLLDPFPRRDDPRIGRALHRAPSVSTSRADEAIPKKTSGAGRETVDSATLQRADAAALGALLLQAVVGESALAPAARGVPRTASGAFLVPIHDLRAAGVPTELLAVLQRALDRDVDQRFTTITEMGAALASAHEALSRSAGGQHTREHVQLVQPTDPLGRHPSRRGLLRNVGIVVVAVLLLGMLALVVWTSSHAAR